VKRFVSLQFLNLRHSVTHLNTANNFTFTTTARQLQNQTVQITASTSQDNLARNIAFLSSIKAISLMHIFSTMNIA
jgi:hypothetical protein